MTTATEDRTYLLAGGRGWLDVHPDGTATVRDGYGRAVAELPASTVQHYMQGEGLTA